MLRFLRGSILKWDSLTVSSYIQLWCYYICSNFRYVWEINNQNGKNELTIIKEIMKNEIENLSHWLETICHISCFVLTRRCQSYFSSTFKWFSPLRRLRFVYTLVYNHKSIHSIPNNMFFVSSNSEIQVSLWKMVPLATQNIYAEG